MKRKDARLESLAYGLKHFTGPQSPDAVSTAIYPYSLSF
jgi:hypothetical protein